MQIVLAWLLLLAIVALIAALIRPRWVLRWGENKTRGRALRWGIPIVLVLFILVGATGDSSQRSASDGAAAPKVEQTNKEFTKDVKQAAKEKNGDKLTALYAKAIDDEQRSIVADAICDTYVPWVADLQKKDRFSIGLAEELVKYEEALRFVDGINHPKLEGLRTIHRNINSQLTNDENWKAEKSRFSGKEQFLENAGKSEWLDGYVTKRVKSAMNLKIGNIELTENYSDQYVISSYKTYGDTAIPNGEWQAVVTFKKTTPVRRGVMRVQAVNVGESKFNTSDGFELNLPVYVEVDQRDVEYSKKLMAYRVYKKGNVNSINKALAEYEAAKKQ